MDAMDGQTSVSFQIISSQIEQRVFLKKKLKKILVWPGFEPAISDYWTDALVITAILADIWKHEKNESTLTKCQMEFLK